MNQRPAPTRSAKQKYPNRARRLATLDRGRPSCLHDRSVFNLPSPVQLDIVLDSARFDPKFKILNSVAGH